jgi:hypothetical protein
MTVQEVIMRAMAKKFIWTQAGEIIGLCERQMRRWKERYLEVGYDGLFDRRTGKPSPKRVPVATVEEILGRYQENYADYNVEKRCPVLLSSFATWQRVSVSEPFVFCLFRDSSTPNIAEQTKSERAILLLCDKPAGITILCESVCW